MGISIKRAETEALARQVAEATGVSLTDAIHNALADTLKALGLEPEISDERRREIQAFFAELDAMPRNDLTREEIEADMYGEFGEPI
ncbi:hypothetical protein AS593_18795 [Caulobacter vibrioides]|jgi:antitoxin VapB|uniref:Transcription factor n=1 Tax=Caulobacter radicis TaxID=2172650 RepID=A0A2T9J0F9_9CAUL|nr:type II toxin-antitoxin system VapB family antitoxin [Caulobacter radicis]KSB87962.1 hypothetical protein AS593_18795 [Caulobacter vibrioides]PVM73299.1 hypothetical protein DDF65_21300 [Caulobacter radicis]